MIKAIIFDCYGVLVTDSWLPFKNEYFGQDPELMEKARYLNYQCDKGLIDYTEFLTSLADLAKVSLPDVTALIEKNSTNQSLFDYIRELKKSYKIGILSNAGSDHLRSLFSSDEIECFDAVALSYERGFVKPDPMAYRGVAQQLEVSENECVMIDDIQRNCSAAEDTGMKSILYQNFSQFKEDLEKLLNTKS